MGWAAQRSTSTLIGHVGCHCLIAGQKLCTGRLASSTPFIGCSGKQEPRASTQMSNGVGYCFLLCFARRKDTSCSSGSVRCEKSTVLLRQLGSNVASGRTAFVVRRYRQLDFFTNIHLCQILLSKMTPVEKYCHFWPGGSA
jgi:hypothetical protein